MTTIINFLFVSSLTWNLTHWSVGRLQLCLWEMAEGVRMCWNSLLVKWLCFDFWKSSYLVWGRGLLELSMSTKSLFVQTDHDFGWNRYGFLDLLDLDLRSIVILCILTWNWNVHRNRYALLVVHVELTSYGVMENLWSLPKTDGSRNRCLPGWIWLPSKSSFFVASLGIISTWN